MTSDKLISLENIRKQYQQDLILVHNGHVFKADTATMFFLYNYKEALDRDGYPVPMRSEADILSLKAKLETTFGRAKENYFNAMAKLDLHKLTEVKDDTEEHVE